MMLAKGRLGNTPTYVDLSLSARRCVRHGERASFMYSTRITTLESVSRVCGVWLDVHMVG